MINKDPEERLLQAKTYMAYNGFAELLSNSTILAEGLKIAAGIIASPDPDLKLPKHMKL